MTPTKSRIKPTTKRKSKYWPYGSKREAIIDALEQAINQELRAKEYFSALGHGVSGENGRIKALRKIRNEMRNANENASREN